MTSSKIIVAILFLSCLAIGAKGQEVQKVHVIKLSWERGYGPFLPGLKVHPKTLKKGLPEFEGLKMHLKGIPTSWTSSIDRQLWFDAEQFVYQNYLKGNISKDLFDSYNTDSTENTKVFLDSALKCYTHMIYTYNSDNKIVCKVDTDNDLDFDDELAFEPPLMNWQKIDSLGMSAPTIRFQLNYQKQAINLEANLLVVNIGNKLMTNLAMHAVGKIVVNNKAFTIRLNREFSSPDDRAYSIVCLENDSFGRKFEFSEMIPHEQWIFKKQYLTINGKKYQNLGFDLNSMTLTLGEISDSINSELSSNQLDFIAKDFEGENFTTGAKIKLSRYYGSKYVLLNFWGTWCGPCVKKIPELQELKQKIGSAEFEIIGIASNEDPIRFKKFLEKNSIKWPQILSSDLNDIVKLYNVTAFPTSYLLDKKGKIIAINLTGQELFDKINSLVK
jgi:thiol-disulfide isomerase/thioredoxin